MFFSEIKTFERMMIFHNDVESKKVEMRVKNVFNVVSIYLFLSFHGIMSTPMDK